MTRHELFCQLEPIAREALKSRDRSVVKVATLLAVIVGCIEPTASRQKKGLLIFLNNQASSWIKFVTDNQLA